LLIACCVLKFGVRELSRMGVGMGIGRG
jgi:hypothetical protein